MLSKASQRFTLHRTGGNPGLGGRFIVGEFHTTPSSEV